MDSAYSKKNDEVQIGAFIITWRKANYDHKIVDSFWIGPCSKNLDNVDSTKSIQRRSVDALIECLTEITGSG